MTARHDFYLAERVMVHPRFKFVLNEQGNVTSTQADLAALLLPDLEGERVEEPVPLALKEAHVGEELVAVHHGASCPRLSGEDRRSLRMQVSGLGAGGGDKVVFEQVERRRFRSQSLAGAPTFTSVHAHEAWIREQIGGNQGGLPTTKP